MFAREGSADFRYEVRLVPKGEFEPPCKADGLLVPGLSAAPHQQPIDDPDEKRSYY